MNQDAVTAEPTPIPDDIIDHLCTGSDNMLDASLKPRLQALKGRCDATAKEEFRSIIGDCINYSLCSSLVLTLFQVSLWPVHFGGTTEEVCGKICVTPVE